MARNYLSIPGALLICSPIISIYQSFHAATSVDVERIFSRGRILLSHIRNRLSVQSTRALICLGAWSRMGLVLDSDVSSVAVLPELEEDEEALADGWDAIFL
jgi:hypothetical protein